MILKAQKEERKRKAEENRAEAFEINRMKIKMEREQQKAALDTQMAQITASTQANIKMIEFLTSITNKLIEFLTSITNKLLYQIALT